MAVIVNIDHSTNDFSQWTSTVEDGGDLSVSAAAAQAGSAYGMSALLDDTTAIYGSINLGLTTNSVRYRFYIDPNSFTLPTTKAFYACTLITGGSGYLYLQFRFLSGTGYQLRLRMYNDGRAGIVSTAWHVISDAPHYVEIVANRATSNVASDATCELFIDGVSKESLSGIDLFDNWPYDSLRLGITSAPSGVPSGTVYFDQLIVNDDGSPIGEHRETEITTLQPADSGFVSNFISSETTDAETIYAAQGAGTNICLESVTINCMNPATVIIGAGSTGGSVDTEIIGPIDVTEIAPPYTVEFTRPVVLDANTALTIDTGSTVLVQCTATGYVK